MKQESRRMTRDMHELSVGHSAAPVAWSPRKIPCPPVMIDRDALSINATSILCSRCCRLLNGKCCLNWESITERLSALARVGVPSSVSRNGTTEAKTLCFFNAELRQLLIPLLLTDTDTE